MPIYFNKNWTKRDYECTNIVAVEAPSKPTIGYNGAPADYWESNGCRSIVGMDKIGSFGGMTFWGYL